MKHLYDDTGFPVSETAIKAKYLQPGAPLHVDFVVRNNKTDRMIAQQGGFSICRSILGDHGEIISAAIGGESTRILFYKLIIPANLKTVFLKKLHSMNITANALFPDIDGLGRSITELIQIETSHD